MSDTEFMATLRMKEIDVARNIAAVLAKVQEGNEVLIEQNDRPVALLKKAEPPRPGRKLSECIANAKVYESALSEAPVPDEGFAADVLSGIEGRRDALGPPPWE